MSFTYNGYLYNYIPVTDTEFENTYLKYQDGNYNYQEDCLLVISIEDIYERDMRHYKLIASILNY